MTNDYSITVAEVRRHAHNVNQYVWPDAAIDQIITDTQAVIHDRLSITEAYSQIAEPTKYGVTRNAIITAAKQKILSTLDTYESGAKNAKDESDSEVKQISTSSFIFTSKGITIDDELDPDEF